MARQELWLQREHPFLTTALRSTIFKKHTIIKCKTNRYLALLGEAAYWDDRYRESEDPNEDDMSAPFDWLFSYEDVKEIIRTLIPDTNNSAFLIGCGNAPFSIDMYNDGYHKIRNSDYSEVVISQQKRKFPHTT